MVGSNTDVYRVGAAMIAGVNEHSIEAKGPERAAFKLAFMKCMAMYIDHADDAARNSMMTALSLHAPLWGCMMPKPVVDELKQVVLPGYGEMTAEDAEALVFELWRCVNEAKLLR